jgi:hypothetical protein
MSGARLLALAAQRDAMTALALQPDVGSGLEHSAPTQRLAWAHSFRTRTDRLSHTAVVRVMFSW